MPGASLTKQLRALVSPRASAAQWEASQSVSQGSGFSYCRPWAPEHKDCLFIAACDSHISPEMGIGFGNLPADSSGVHSEILYYL